MQFVEEPIHYTDQPTVAAIEGAEAVFGTVGGGVIARLGMLRQGTTPAAVTDDAIRAALATSDLQTAQFSISRPTVERYVRRLEAGDVAPPIKVDGKVIVEGNHRYVAGRIVGREPAQAAGTLAPRQASDVRPVQKLVVDPADWEN